MQHEVIQDIQLLFKDSTYVKGAFGCYFNHIGRVEHYPLCARHALGCPGRAR